MSKEQDIQELCKQTTEINTIENYRGNPSCPFCRGESWNYIKDSMQDIKHESRCAYTIAKDLITRVEEQ